MIRVNICNCNEIQSTSTVFHRKVRARVFANRTPWPHHIHVPSTSWKAVCHALQCLCSNPPSRSYRKNRFYTDLWNLLINVTTNDKTDILSDFNTRMGWDTLAWKCVLGLHGNKNLQWQWAPSAWILYQTATFYHEDTFPSKTCLESYLDAPSFQTLAHARLYRCMPVVHERYPSQ